MPVMPDWMQRREGPPEPNDMLSVACDLIRRRRYEIARRIADSMMRDASHRRVDARLDAPSHGIWCGMLIALDALCDAAASRQIRSRGAL